MSEPKRAHASLEQVTEIVDVRAVGGDGGRLRAVTDRFGFLPGDAEQPTRTAVPDRARVLLVGWNSVRPAQGAVVVDRSPSVAAATASVELQRRPRRRRATAVAVADAEPAVALDRWAIVSLLPDGDAPAVAERTVLEMLCAAVETGVDEAGGPRRRAAARPLLSPRERECLQWTAAGKTTWEIAAILEISQNTIDGYIASAARKLAAVNRTQAVAEALRRGLID